jgi:hypothetical protein
MTVYFLLLDNDLSEAIDESKGTQNCKSLRGSLEFKSKIG